MSSTENILAGELCGLSLERSISPILDFGEVGKNANNNNSSNYAKLNDSAYESISDMQESDDVKPVFSDKLFHYDQSSSDEGFEGSPAILRTPTKSTKLTSKWRSPSKSQHSTQPYLIEASPIRIQRTSRNKKYEAEQKLEKEQTDDKEEEEVKVDFIAELTRILVKCLFSLNLYLYLSPTQNFDSFQIQATYYIYFLTFPYIYVNLLCLFLPTTHTNIHAPISPFPLSGGVFEHVLIFFKMFFLEFWNMF